jgi:hypothetical protein
LYGTINLVSNRGICLKFRTKNLLIVYKLGFYKFKTLYKGLV